MTSTYSTLSDKAIIRLMDEGEIIISPFNINNIGTSSYDVTLGEWYYREQELKNEWTSSIYNIYSEENVHRIWGNPIQALSHSYYQEHGINLENIDPDEKIIFVNPGETILCHSVEFIGAREKATTMMKARSSMGRNFIEVCKCVSGDSLISLQNGLSVRIDSLIKSDDQINEDIVVQLDNDKQIDILTWGKTSTIELDGQKSEIIGEQKDNIYNTGKISHLIKRKVKQNNCIKLTLSDGRHIIVTPEHKILNDKKEWIIAEKLKLEDKIICNLNNSVEDKNYGDENDFELICDPENNEKWSMKNDRDKILAFARICGMLITDGHLHEKYSGNIFVGARDDANQVISDIKLVTGINSVTCHIRDRQYQIYVPAKLAYLCKFHGCQFGNKTYKSIEFPSFVNNSNCPKSVLREFISAMWGGDGSKPCFSKESINTIHPLILSSKVIDENGNELNHYLISIKKMEYLGDILNKKFGIKNTIIYRYYTIIDGEQRMVHKTDNKYDIIYSWKEIIILYLQSLSNNTCTKTNLIEHLKLECNKNKIYPEFTSNNLLPSLKKVIDDDLIICKKNKDNDDNDNNDIFELTEKGKLLQIKNPNELKNGGINIRIGIDFDTMKDGLSFYTQIGLRYCIQKNARWSIWASYMNHNERIRFEWWRSMNAALDLYYKYSNVNDPREWRKKINDNDILWKDLVNGFSEKNYKKKSLASNCYDFIKNKYIDDIDINLIFYSKKNFTGKWATPKGKMMSDLNTIPYYKFVPMSIYKFMEDSGVDIDPKKRSFDKYFSLKIIKKEILKNEIDVYDISVPTSESFVCNNVVVHNCAGWGDIGFFNRYVMEITNNSKHYKIPLICGRRIAQIIFFLTEGIMNKSYNDVGKYQTTNDLDLLKATWKPHDMIPKLYLEKPPSQQKNIDKSKDK